MYPEPFYNKCECVNATYTFSTAQNTCVCKDGGVKLKAIACITEEQCTASGGTVNEYMNCICDGPNMVYGDSGCQCDANYFMNKGACTPYQDCTDNFGTPSPTGCACKAGAI